MVKPKLLFLAGPTAVGKSATAVILAKKINGEIISCDSMQIYKGMDILTSKPLARAQKGVTHHLISAVSPAAEYDVSKYCRLAAKKISEIIKRRKTPLIVGGTGLYMALLIDGIFKDKARDPGIRNRLYESVKIFGSRHLYDKLKKADPASAVKIHPHDTKRIVRALEVFENTGKPLSLLQKKRKGLSDKYDIKIACLNMPRQMLYKRIEARVKEMFDRGLLNEVKKLLQQNLSQTASRAIGIRELQGYFDGLYDLNTAKRMIARNTCLYAKRQLTWFRKDKRIQWINIGANDKPGDISKKVWKEFSS